MPVRTHQIENGARVLLFTCDVCGAPACYGYDVSLREALETGDARKAGRWYCRTHLLAGER